MIMNKYESLGAYALFILSENVYMNGGMYEHPGYKNELIWVDIETTGLDPTSDTILEIAIVITNSNLDTIVDYRVIAIHHDEAILHQMGDWCKKQHFESGLWDRVLRSGVNMARAEQLLLSFLTSCIKPDVSPMCGNNVCFDRQFLQKYMPKLTEHFHYRNLDVSTVKELVNIWRPDLQKGFTKKLAHRALDDINESIAELQYYKDHFINFS